MEKKHCLEYREQNELAIATSLVKSDCLRIVVCTNASGGEKTPPPLCCLKLDLAYTSPITPPSSRRITTVAARGRPP